ncbi:MAG: Rpn family recombination-promoting nuclease/putative transposase [Lachnospiraceae bacterium]|nr:Rpn family recombination-promoting nuclease/putative transposase [Lachnospiraceae bacterium]
MPHFSNVSGALSPTAVMSYENYLPKPPEDIARLIAGMGGKLRHTLLNDYLFRALLQENNTALKSLICSVLHLREEEVVSVTITNPILLGKSIERKSFLLDVNVLMNDDTRINLELQAENLYNWPERSLGYLCRNFDHLNKGEDYVNTKSSIHISILNYVLFKEHPEFHGIYKLLNVKNHTVYTDKFCLHVINLPCSHMITEKDRRYGLHLWASLFGATTWEEIKMLAKKHAHIRAAAETIYQLDNHETIQWLCEREEDAINRERAIRELIAKKDATIDELKRQIEELKKR